MVLVLYFECLLHFSFSFSSHLIIIGQKIIEDKLSLKSNEIAISCMNKLIFSHTTVQIIDGNVLIDPILKLFLVVIVFIDYKVKDSSDDDKTEHRKSWSI